MFFTGEVLTLRAASCVVLWLIVLSQVLGYAEEPAKSAWNYRAELLRPFWQGNVVEDESVLFIRDEITGEARASVLFPQYRDALRELTGPGVALADLTSIWTEFLERKQDWDQTGNGVDHPNDFGHRVYAQVISVLLDPQGELSLSRWQSSRCF
jgi:hypothetical protein